MSAAAQAVPGRTGVRARGAAGCRCVAAFAVLLVLAAPGRAIAARRSVDDVVRAHVEQQDGSDSPSVPAARLAALRASGGYTDAALADFVPSLPGLGPVDDFNLFAGWVALMCAPACMCACV